MQILKYLLVVAVLVFQIDFAHAGIKKIHKAHGKSHVSGPRTASYYKAAKYFKAPKKTSKVAKNTKLKKSAKSKRTVASVSSSRKHKPKKAKHAKLGAKKKHLR